MQEPCSISTVTSRGCELDDVAVDRRHDEQVPQVILGSLVMIDGNPPWQAVRHRKVALQFFYMKRFLVTHLPHVGWRNTPAVEYYVAPEMQGVCSPEVTTTWQQAKRTLEFQRGSSPWALQWPLRPRGLPCWPAGVRGLMLRGVCEFCPQVAQQ